MYSHKTIITVLSLAFVAFICGHILVAFLMAISMALLLAQSADVTPPNTESQHFPSDNWSITQVRQNIQVSCPSCVNDNIMRFMVGHSRRLELNTAQNTPERRDVAVQGQWIDPFGQIHQAQLGHVSRQQLQPLYSEVQRDPKFRISARPSEVFTPSRTNGFPGLCIDVAVIEPVQSV